SSEGETLLIVTAIHGLDTIMQELLRSGADPGVKNKTTGQSALHYAATSGSVGCARSILEAGGDHDAVDNQNIHACHLAALKGHFDIIRLLAAYGSDVGKVALDGNTPLHHAAAEGYGPMCKFLAQRGCPAGLKNKEGKTPKLLAKENEHKEAMKECRKAEKQSAKLSKGGGKGGDDYSVRLYDWLQEHEEKVLGMFQQFDPEDEEGGRHNHLNRENFVMCLQSLNCPVEVNDLEKVAIAHDPSKEDKVDYALFISCKKVISKQKKKKKGGKKGRKKKGKTKIPLPICTAPDGPRSKNGGPPQDLLERYVHFTDNTRFGRDNPPVHPIQDDSAWYLNFPDTSYLNISDAAKLGDLESLKAAFIKGTHVDQRDKYYKTPLMAACSHGNIDMAQFLLDLGAKIQLPNKKGHTALDVAKAYADPRVVALVQKRWDEIPPPVDKNKRGGSPRKRGTKSAPGQSKTHMPSVKAAPEQKEEISATAIPSVIQTTRKSSVLRAASALGIINERPKSIVYTPKRAWLSQPSTEELLRAKEIQRVRFGTDVDFSDYKRPFQKHIVLKADAFAAQDNS
ncbi:hypothetical protein QZH41_011175, partial [Actinostola sp. cb2023]